MLISTLSNFVIIALTATLSTAGVVLVSSVTKPNHRMFLNDKELTYDQRLPASIVPSAVILVLRGGAEGSSNGNSLVALIKSTIINTLKLVVPKSWWPKSWKKGGKSSKMMSKEHLEKSFAKGDSTSRVQKELRSFIANPPSNCKVVVGANIRSWVINIVGAEDTIYAGEKYKLKIVFPKDYPSKPPSVYFLRPTPKHVHVYSNGDICLNLLGRDWRPTMTAQTLVLSIMSMLASAKEKKMPQDNAAHADNEPGQQQQGWLYHDEKC